MLAFPPVLPDTTLRWSTRLARDHYVRVDTNDYSVNPRYVGRRIEVRVDLDTVVHAWITHHRAKVTGANVAGPRPGTNRWIED